MEDRIISTMNELGFTATDAKAYLGLLRNHPATGYELASSTGVPRSAIYNVLGRLQSLGLINVVQEKPAKYLPLAPEKLFDLLRERFSSRLDDLKSSLRELDCDTQRPATWTIEGYREVIDHARSLIKNAERSVFASLWGREAEQLADLFESAAANGVEVVLFSFNPLPQIARAHSFSYHIPEERLNEYWSHKLILICDHERVLVGGAEDRASNRAVVTEEKAIVEMALSNLVLDITLLAQRTGVETSGVMNKLTHHMAPVEELIGLPAKAAIA